MRHQNRILQRYAYSSLLLASAIGFAIVLSAPSIAEDYSIESPALVDHGRASSVQLCHLLYFKEIRDKLGVSDEVFMHVEDALNPLRRAAPTYDAFAKSTFDEKLAVLDEVLAEADGIDASVWGLLTEILAPDRLDALLGSYVNYFGTPALLNKRVLGRLSATDEQAAALKAAFAESRKDRRSVFTDIASGKFKDSANKPVLLLVEDAGAKAVLGVLNDQQRKELAKIVQAGRELAPDTVRFSFGW